MTLLAALPMNIKGARAIFTSFLLLAATLTTLLFAIPSADASTQTKIQSKAFRVANRFHLLVVKVKVVPFSLGTRRFHATKDGFIFMRSDPCFRCDDWFTDPKGGYPYEAVTVAAATVVLAPV
jgi:hypothetical protein